MTDYKQHRLILDPKLSILKHITENVGIAQMCEWLHLDYCDMIYHIPAITKVMSDVDSHRNLNYLMGTLGSVQMGTLEIVQYQAAYLSRGHERELDPWPETYD